MQQGTRRPYRVASLFAGIGGFCRAFQRQGFEVVWANDSDQFACETYRLNYPSIRLLAKPIEEVSVALDALEPVDVLTAGFPCQSFSVAGSKQGFEDPRGKTFFDIIRLLHEFGENKPKILLLENVFHLLKHDNGKTFSKVMDEVVGAGYWFSSANVAVLNTSEHTEIPQIRQRLFIAALSIDHFAYNDFRFPLAVDKQVPYREFLDLDSEQDEWHYFGPESRWGKLFIEAIAEGNPESPYQLRRYYVRELKNNLIPTLTANMGDGGHNQPVIKDRWGIRKFTVSECLRFQGFDERFQFPEEVSRSQRYKQVGNSVTVPLVEKLAQECLRLLDRADIEKEQLWAAK